MITTMFIHSGHIEMSGQPVDSFTQQDIDSGVISYVHGSTSDKQLNKTSLRLTLQVSTLLICHYQSLVVVSLVVGCSTAEYEDQAWISRSGKNVIGFFFHMKFLSPAM